MLLEIRLQLRQPHLDRPTMPGGVIFDVLVDGRNEVADLSESGSHHATSAGGIGTPTTRAPSIQVSIASFAFSIASCLVSPCEMQPGRLGTSAIQPPSCQSR